MSTYDTTADIANERTDPRPDYIVLGTEAKTGAQHLYDTTTETVHIIHPDGSRERKQLLCGPATTVDDYVEAVADSRGWDDRRYGRDLFAEFLAPYAEAGE